MAISNDTTAPASGTTAARAPAVHESTCTDCSRTEAKQVLTSNAGRCDDCEAEPKLRPELRPAVALLRQFEAQARELDDDEVARQIARHTWTVSRELTGWTAQDPDDGFTVSQTWTRKGLRHHLAILNLVQDLLDPDDGADAHGPDAADLLQDADWAQRVLDADEALSEAAALVDVLMSAADRDMPPSGDNLAFTARIALNKLHEARVTLGLDPDPRPAGTEEAA